MPYAAACIGVDVRIAIISTLILMFISGICFAKKEKMTVEMVAYDYAWNPQFAAETYQALCSLGMPDVSSLLARATAPGSSNFGRLTASMGIVAEQMRQNFGPGSVGLST